MCMTLTTFGEFKTPQRMYKVIRWHNPKTYVSTMDRYSCIGPFSLTPLPTRDNWIEATEEFACKTWIDYPPGFHVFTNYTDTVLYMKDLEIKNLKIIPVNVHGSYTKGTIELYNTYTTVGLLQDLPCYAVQKLQVANQED